MPDSQVWIIIYLKKRLASILIFLFELFNSIQIVFIDVSLPFITLKFWSSKSRTSKLRLRLIMNSGEYEENEEYG